MIDVVCLDPDCAFGSAFEDRPVALTAFDLHRLTTGHTVRYSNTFDAQMATD